MRSLTVAATQMRCDWDIPGNLDRAEALIREAASRGAGLILLQELFETPYFCQDQIHDFLRLAAPLEGNKLRFEVRPAALSMHLPADSPLLSSTGRLGLPEG